MSEIGDFIKAKRKETGKSQKALAIACGLKHDSVLNRIESGERKVTWDELGRISIALGNFHIFDALLVAGFIKESDIHPEMTIHHINELNDNEIKDVQDYVDFLIFKREKPET